MKLKFKTYPYQTEAVSAIVDCFKGQPKSESVGYRIDLGKTTDKHGHYVDGLNDAGFKNPPVAITDDDLLKNIQDVQAKQVNLGLPKSASLYRHKTAGCPINLDIEMETGTGKTYCYIKTMFELNQKYGWSKFIIVVPSIAIREGVAKSIEFMQEHFKEEYNKSIRSFIYSSKSLQNIESFSTDGGINVMIINVQAFNTKGKDNRRIYEELDSFSSRRPIDVIKANNPILILDEPQKMEGQKTLESFKEFKAMMMLRYSATHKTEHNKVYRLDAIDAYNQKLVKKINVRGISVKGQGGNMPYVYMGGFNIRNDKAPTVNMEFEQKLKSGIIKRVHKKLEKGSNLYDESNELEVYKDRYTIASIDASLNKVTFENGKELSAGDVVGDSNEADLRRIQIREAINSHFDKEEILYNQGIKCLSLFFIDSVAKYKQYDENGVAVNGEYADIFEAEYIEVLNEKLDLEPTPYQEYLKDSCCVPSMAHNGYFSVDKKTKQLKDPGIQKSGDAKGEANDVDAYDLILKDKQRLLSFKERTRFIFSHSALSEGWDNPNVFTICTLKNSSSEMRRRQEIGRGLRLCVNKHGERMDDPETTHNTNVLTVIPSESYEDFAKNLQKEIKDSVSARPNKADEKYFVGKILSDVNGDTVLVDENIAKDIYRYLLKNDYTDNNDKIRDIYRDAKENESIQPLPEALQPYAESIFKIIDNTYDGSTNMIKNDHENPSLYPNSNIKKKEFLNLWNKINRKAAYKVDFDTQELIEKSIANIDSSLAVSKLEYQVTDGTMKDGMDYDDVDGGEIFVTGKKSSVRKTVSPNSTTQYDLLEQVSKNTQLTRHTVASILSKINSAKFSLYKSNPEEFIAKVSQLINEQKATTIVEKITYNTLDETFVLDDIFTENKCDISEQEKLGKHVYDYLKADSKIEKQFVKELEVNTDVVVYSKLPRGFFIPTPVGKYNPDWAIVFKEGSVKHIYFVAETKGSMSSTVLNEIEKSKISCAKKYFHSISNGEVSYDVVDTYDNLMNIVS